MKMFSWLSKNANRGKKLDDVHVTVVEELKRIYKQTVVPLEEHYSFHAFHSPILNDADFEAKPMILLVGQYSTGKTTLIRYLLERDFPGMNIGPEPTTDKFMAVMHGELESVIPGNALVVDPSKQYKPLSKFGNAFLNRFQCSALKSKVLENLTIVDTPGILSGEKQRVDRGYDFVGVMQWFAERSDRIILLFDAHKLDISDEFSRGIEALQGNEEKILILLNKADGVDSQQLMRVYGALMWALSKVLNAPEVPKVYVGSFWDQPLKHDTNRKLFEAEQQDLFKELEVLPRNSALRKLNDLLKRARLAKVHAYIISSLHKEMPWVFCKLRKKKHLITNLGSVYKAIHKEHLIPLNDFPDESDMQEKLKEYDFATLRPLKPRLINAVNHMLLKDVAQVMSKIPKEQAQDSTMVQGRAFHPEVDSPFGKTGLTSIDAVSRSVYDKMFQTLMPVDGKISGATAKEEMVKSKLPRSILAHIWKLSDIDCDGQLDADEFALAMHLTNLKVQGEDMPDELPDYMIPSSKK